MASTIQVGGPVGPFFDQATGQSVGGRVWGTCAFELAPGADPNMAQSQLSPNLMSAVSNVLLQKVMSNQVPLAAVPGAFRQFFPEIAAAAGMQGLGVHIVNLELQIALDGAGAGAPPPQQQQQQQASPPQNAGPNIGYQINVGGMRFRGSTDGGLDTKGLQNQLVEKAKSEIFWWILTAVIVLAVLGGLAGLGIYIYMAASDTGGGPAKEATWDGKSTFTCAGNDSVKLKGVTAKLASGTAIEAGGNCNLVLEGVQITAPNGIQAGGNVVITMTGGSIDATDTAVKAMGGSKVTLSGTKVKGKKDEMGGKIIGP